MLISTERSLISVPGGRMRWNAPLAVAPSLRSDAIAILILFFLWPKHDVIAFLLFGGWRLSMAVSSHAVYWNYPVEGQQPMPSPQGELAFASVGLLWIVADIMRHAIWH
jgi:hypothetical protein